MVMCEVLSAFLGAITPRTFLTVFTRSGTFYHRYFTTDDFCTSSTPVLTITSSYSLVVITHEDYKI